MTDKTTFQKLLASGVNIICIVGVVAALFYIIVGVVLVIWAFLPILAAFGVGVLAYMLVAAKWRTRYGA